MSVLALMGCLSIALLTDVKSKLSRIGLGVTSFLALVGGFGLMARLGGMNSVANWPLWIYVKLAIWFIISIGAPMVAKRVSFEKRKGLFWVFFICFFIAVLFAVNKYS